MKILINLITQNILWYSNCLSTVNAIEDMKTLDGISKKEYKQLETEFKTACWAITNLHQKWWPWCKRPQSQTVAICLRQTWYHALLSTHMAPQHAQHGSHSLTRLFIRCFRVSFCLSVCFQNDLYFEIFRWIYSKLHVWQKGQYACIDPRNVTWFRFGIHVSFFFFFLALQQYPTFLT